MAINIKAKETLQNIGPYKDTYRDGTVYRKEVWDVREIMLSL